MAVIGAHQHSIFQQQCLAYVQLMVQYYGGKIHIEPPKRDIITANLSGNRQHFARVYRAPLSYELPSALEEYRGGTRVIVVHEQKPR
jgi:hypothetical protein